MTGVFPKEFADLEAVGGPWAFVSHEERLQKLGVPRMYGASVRYGFGK
jgi:hypothetical protein